MIIYFKFIPKMLRFFLAFVFIVTIFQGKTFAMEAKNGETKYNKSAPIIKVLSREIPVEVKERANKNGKKVIREAAELRTENSYSYQLSDGTYIEELSPDSENYLDENGIWQPIRTDLVTEKDMQKTGAPISRELFSVQARASEGSRKTKYIGSQLPYYLELPKVFADGYTVGKGDASITLTPVGSSASEGTLTDSNSLRYENVWEQTDVTLTVNKSSVKEDIILKDESAPTTFSYEVTGPISDDLTSGTLSIAPAWLIDHAGATREVSQVIRRDADKNYIDITANTEGLEYPIIIDPTVIASPLGYRSPVQINTGNLYTNPDTLYVNRYSNPVYPGIPHSYGYNYPILYFNMSSGAFPTTSDKITNATLVLQVRTISVAMDVYGESSSVQTNSVSIAPGDLETRIDVTSFVKSWFNYASDPLAYNYAINGIDIAVKTENIVLNGAQYYGTSNVADLVKPKLLIAYDQFAPGSAGIINPAAGTSIDSNYTITWIPALDQDDTQNTIKYQIQLSTNNGSTWNDIVALTSAGVSSYTYNFNSIANTSAAKIRIRAYDGVMYGDWSMSGTFTIKHNQAPSAPISMSPGGSSSGTAVLVKGAGLGVSWQFVDPDAGDTQSAYRVKVYQTSGSLQFDSGWVTSSMASYTIPDGQLSRGSTYSWSVQTKDQSGLASPESALKYMKINRLPQAVWTSYTDNQSVPDNQLTFTWTYSDSDAQAQVKYQIQGSKDNWATIAFNSNEISSAATTYSNTFSQGKWSFRLRVFDGLEWSTPIDRSNLTLPNAYEPNDTPAQATSIQYSQAYDSLINSSTDVDFFKYKASTTGIDRVTLTVPPNLNYDVYVYDASMNLLAIGGRGAGVAENVLYDVSGGSDYYFKIVGVNGDYSASASYSLMVKRVTSQTQTTYQYDSNGNLITKSTITTP